jgi:hypothetical protein
MVDMVAVSQHHDAEFISKQAPGQEGNYLAPTQGGCPFQRGRGIHQTWAFDAKLVFTGGSTAEGTPATGADGKPLHSSHYGGLNIDLKYMSVWGSPRTSADSDLWRAAFIMDASVNQNANLGAALTGTPSRFGLPDFNPRIEAEHMSHMHFQKNYPPSPKKGQ